MKKKIAIILAIIIIVLGFVAIITTKARENSDLRYESDTLSIEIEPITKEEENIKMWVSTIKIKDPTQLKSAFSGDDFESGKKEKTSKIAKRNNAIFAVNGAATGFSDRGVIIRDGKIYRSKTKDVAPLVIKDNGDLDIYGYGEKNAEELLAEGARHTYDFGPDIVVNGDIPKHYKQQPWFASDYQPRTAIGQKNPLEYIVITVDGRSNKSRGMSCEELAQEFINRGCNIAYNLDGGGSATLYFKGKVINNPSDIFGERKITDILYFTE